MSHRPIALKTGRGMNILSRFIPVKMLLQSDMYTCIFIWNGVERHYPIGREGVKIS